MQILSVHNWNCVRCFGNMFNINLKQVILGTRVWSFSYWHQLCSSRRLCLYYGFFVTCLTDPLPESPPLCPGSMLEGDGAAHRASPELGSFQTKHQRAGSMGSYSMTCCGSQGGTVPGGCPAHLPTAGDIQVTLSCWTKGPSSSFVSLFFLLKVCAWKEGKHEELVPWTILSACSFQLRDIGSPTFNWGIVIPSCWSACVPVNLDCWHMLGWHTPAVFHRIIKS